MVDISNFLCELWEMVYKSGLEKLRRYEMECRNARIEWR